MLIPPSPIRLFKYPKSILREYRVQIHRWLPSMAGSAHISIVTLNSTIPSHMLVLLSLAPCVIAQAYKSFLHDESSQEARYMSQTEMEAESKGTLVLEWPRIMARISPGSWYITDCNYLRLSSVAMTKGVSSGCVSSGHAFSDFVSSPWTLAIIRSELLYFRFPNMILPSERVLYMFWETLEMIKHLYRGAAMLLAMETCQIGRTTSWWWMLWFRA